MLISSGTLVRRTGSVFKLSYNKGAGYESFVELDLDLVRRQPKSDGTAGAFEYVSAHADGAALSMFEANGTLKPKNTARRAARECRAGQCDDRAVLDRL